MKIVPMYDRVLIRKEEIEKTSSGGIVLPDSATEERNEGTVIAVGPGRIYESGYHHPVSVKVGDKVLFTKLAGVVVKENGEELLLMKEEQIIAKIDTDR